METMDFIRAPFDGRAGSSATTPFISGQFDITDNLQSSMELSWGSVRANGRGAQTRDTSAGSVITIRGDNAYLPAGVKTALTNAGQPLTSATSFVLGRMGDDFGYTDNVSKTDVLRALAGLSGSITENWKWDAYYQYGETNYDQTIQNNRIQQQVAGVPLATDRASRIQLAGGRGAESGNQGRSCAARRSPIRTNGCQPANLFGMNNFSQAAEGLPVRHGVAGSDLQAARRRGQRSGRSFRDVGRASAAGGGRGISAEQGRYERRPDLGDERLLRVQQLDRRRQGET